MSGKQESADQRAERLIRELREVTAEAAGVRKDMESTLKGARAMIEGYLRDEVQRELNRFTAEWQGHLDRMGQGWVDHQKVVAERQADVVQKMIAIEDATLKQLEQTAEDVCSALSNYDPAAVEIFKAVATARANAARGESTDLNFSVPFKPTAPPPQ